MRYYLHPHTQRRRLDVDVLLRPPYVGKFQPYCGWIALVYMAIGLFAYGYGSFKPWNLQSFFVNYTMLASNVILYAS